MANDARSETRGARAHAWISRSPEATEILGERLGRALRTSAVIALDGDLGSGKTSFVRGLARGLGASEPVTSPTYALLQTYAGRLELRHLDAWMEGRERAFLLDGGMEWLSGAGATAIAGADGTAIAGAGESAIAGAGVTAIEWADRVADVLPLERLAVKLAHRAPTERSIEMRVVGAGQVADELARALEIVASAGPTPDLAESPSR
jgi:tRNA threonylcarbamoyladenosine biosynthesis protein TsaE